MSTALAPPVQLRLQHRAQLSRFDLPTRWLSFEQWVRDDALQGRSVDGHLLPFRRVSEDVLIMPRGELEAALAGLPAAKEESVEIPVAPALVLQWMADVEVVRVHNAAYFGATEQPDTVLRNFELDWQPELAEQRPRDRFAPRELRKCVVNFDLRDAKSRRESIRSGPGLVGFFPLGGYFAAGGELGTGADSSVAWLNVARDEAGDFWMWFSAS